MSQEFKDDFLNKHKESITKVDDESISLSNRVKVALWNAFIFAIAVTSSIFTFSAISFRMFVLQNIEIYDKVIKGLEESGIGTDNHENVLSNLFVGNSGFSFDMLANAGYYQAILTITSLVLVLLTVILIVVTVVKRKNKKKGMFR